MSDYTGLEKVRLAVAKAAGWPWCEEHRVSRCLLHPAKALSAWCGVHERLHQPMEWDDSCKATQ